ncbi:hypothetical protein GCM10009809_19280 [Isoptericola hypogeus]|uniref:4'-phosphopantetheinyl transferase n=1 Tax=Isoptericola hypogeus TaxID=300179 RepID=A0ABP4VIH5_9MICO
MNLDDLVARVDAAYARGDLPSWPPPRPEGAEVSEAEYSRVTDPAKYRVVHARARAWAQVLGALPGVRVEELGPVDGVRADGTREPGRFSRGTRVASSRPGTLPLLLLEADGGPTDHGPTVDLLQVAVASPEHALDEQPDCGCDACDFGSADLLGAVDQEVVRVVGGPLVALRGRDWSATWSPDAGGMTGEPRDDPRFRGRRGFSETMRACRALAEGREVALPRGTAAVVGRAWFE